MHTHMHAYPYTHVHTHIYKIIKKTQKTKNQIPQKHLREGRVYLAYDLQLATEGHQDRNSRQELRDTMEKGSLVVCSVFFFL